MTCGNVTHGDVTLMKDSLSQVSISERDEEFRAEATTDPVRSVTPSRVTSNVTSDVEVMETPKSGDFHLVFDHTLIRIPFHLRRNRYDTNSC